MRPSAAVERGGGFFIPGLEGYKLRLAVALLLSAGLLLNRVLSPGEPGFSQLVSEVLGASGAAYLWAQVAAEEAAQRAAEIAARAAALKPRVTEGEALREQMRRDLEAET